MKKFTILMSMFLMVTCSDDPVVGPPPEPELVGCEAAELYNWESLSFSTTLGQDEEMWISFEVEELAIYSVDLDATGFECNIYDQCDPDNLAVGDSLLRSFVTTGLDEVEMGAVTPGIYYLSMLNTRNRADFNFTINITDIVLGCMDDNAINYNPDANIDSGLCEFNDCNIEWYTSNYGDMIMDCDGNCSPANWVGDGYCDDGYWGIYDEEGNVIPVVLMCEEFNWDEGDCEDIIGECPVGQIEDCNGNCAPESWLGDTFCDDGTYEFEGNQIFFNCEEFENDGGDCDGLDRTSQQRVLPNGRILIAQ